MFPDSQDYTVKPCLEFPSHPPPKKKEGKKEGRKEREGGRQMIHKLNK